MKLKTSDSKTLTSKPEILAEIEGYHGTLYASQNQQPDPKYDDPRATLTRHFTDELPDICLREMELVFRELKNGEAPGEDRVDEFQPPEQAGFRGGYGTVDHIHTVKQIYRRRTSVISLCVWPLWI